MPQIIDINELKGKELFAYLVSNKAALIAQKKSLPQEGATIMTAPSYIVKDDAGGVVVKTGFGEIPEDATSVHVKVVANTSLFCDSHMDVLIRDSGKKSIDEGWGRYHFNQHIQNLEKQIGDVTDIYYQDLPLRELGYNKDGIGQALIYESDVKKEYSPRLFDLYKRGKVKQHSIGLFYKKLDLAINDKDSEKEYSFWKKYRDQLINPEKVDERGYFWVVQEYQLIENSSVVYGANSLTPTIGVKSGTEDEPADDATHEQPPTQENSFDLSAAIKRTKFF